MNSQGSSYLGLWREPAPGAVCLRSGRWPIFISRQAMRGNMGYEQAGFSESSVTPANVIETQKSISQIRLKSPSATSSAESLGPPAAAPGGERNGSEKDNETHDWLKDLNEVTKFDERNIGHDHLFRVEERNKLTRGRFRGMRDGYEDPFPKPKQAATPKGDHVRDRPLGRFAPKTAKGRPEIRESSQMSEDLDDSLVDFLVPADQTNDQDMTPAVGGIPRMISNNLATARKLYQEERAVGGSGDSPKISGKNGIWKPSEDRNQNEDDICRELRLKAKLDNQLDSYMGLWDENGNKRC